MPRLARPPQHLAAGSQRAADPQLPHSRIPGPQEPSSRCLDSPPHLHSEDCCWSRFSALGCSDQGCRSQKLFSCLSISMPCRLQHDDFSFPTKPSSWIGALSATRLGHTDFEACTPRNAADVITRFSTTTRDQNTLDNHVNRTREKDILYIARHAVPTAFPRAHVPGSCWCRYPPLLHLASPPFSRPRHAIAARLLLQDVERDG